MNIDLSSILPALLALFGAVIGIIAGFIPAFINSRTQKQIVELQIQEKQLNEKNLYKLNQVERDIRAIEEAIDSVSAYLRDLLFLATVQENAETSQQKGLTTKEASELQISEINSIISSRYTEFHKSLSRGIIRAYSFDDDIRKKYLEFNDIVTRLYNSIKGINKENQVYLWDNLATVSGNLQRELREFLIKTKSES
jgi:hypothetical protein